MTLRFRDPTITQRFIALCKKRGVNGTVRREGLMDIVTVAEDQFRNKTERTKFVSAWATVSMEVIEPNKGQRSLRYTSDEPDFEVLA